MSYTYSQYVTSLANVLQVEPTNADFLDIIDRIIEYATARVEHDLDLINEHAVATVTLVNGTRTATLPTPSSPSNAGPIYIPESAWVVTPASTQPNAGTRNPLQRVSLEYLNFSWPTVTSTGQPVCFALQDDTTMVMGPAPDQTYVVEVVGVYSPALLSSTNTTTWLSTNLPELFFAASCIWGMGWQRDFGSQSDNPQATQSWESQYQSLLQSDIVFEARKFSRSSGWTPMQPNPVANPPRP